MKGRCAWVWVRIIVLGRMGMGAGKLRGWGVGVRRIELWCWEEGFGCREDGCRCGGNLGVGVGRVWCR